jgi:hypothetical protein
MQCKHLMNLLLQIGELAGLAVGATVLLNVLFAGYKYR